MKHFGEQNYYERLEIPPNASPFEIRRAYRKMFDLYQDDALASYSFFSEEERREILAGIQEAYLTLIDEESREVYDRGLIKKGCLDEEMRYNYRAREPIPLYDFKKTRGEGVESLVQRAERKRRAEENQVIRGILARDRITGADLRRLREEMGVSLEEMAAKTNVRMEILRAMEEERYEDFLPRVYMTGFLRSYIRYLQLEEDVVVRGYFRHVEKHNRE